MRHYTPSRSSYVPSTIPTKKIEVGDVEIHTYEAGGKPYGVAFWGKSSKPVWHFRFESEEKRDRKILDTLKARKGALKRKSEERAARNSYAHDYKVGDCLVSSWGYDQTNVDFYMVTRVISTKSVELVEIGKKRVGADIGADYVVPDPSGTHGKPFTKRVGHGGSVYIGHGHAHKVVENKKYYETAFGWGH